MCVIFSPFACFISRERERENVERERGERGRVGELRKRGVERERERERLSG